MSAIAKAIDSLELMLTLIASLAFFVTDHYFAGGFLALIVLVGLEASRRSDLKNETP